MVGFVKLNFKKSGDPRIEPPDIRYMSAIPSITEQIYELKFYQTCMKRLLVNVEEKKI